MIFGVDLATRRIAVACPDAKFVFVSSTARRAADKREFVTEAQAGAELGRRACAAIGEALGYEGHTFFAERPFVGSHPTPNMRTAVGQGLSAGAALAHLPGPTELIDHPSQWKKELLGHGNAKPADYVAWLEASDPALAALCESDEDAHAACCIALWAEMAQARELL